jgi:hypothetical protein
MSETWNFGGMKTHLTVSAIGGRSEIESQSGPTMGVSKFGRPHFLSMSKTAKIRDVLFALPVIREIEKGHQTLVYPLAESRKGIEVGRDEIKLAVEMPQHSRRTRQGNSAHSWACVSENISNIDLKRMEGSHGHRA